MTVGNSNAFTYDEKRRIVDSTNNNLALTRGWNSVDGSSVVMWNKGNAVTQKFTAQLDSA